MKAGNFNIDDYLGRLYEEAEEQAKQTGQTSFMDGGEGTVNADGIVIPQENKKSYDWLKSEFQKGKVEVKVEMKLGGAKFEPGYDLQTDLDSVKDFKPGMFGEVKTADTKGSVKVAGDEKKPSFDAKKDKESFQKGEGDAEKKELSKTKAPKEDIKNKEGEKKEEPEEKEEKEEKPEEKSKEEPEVKKIDLKTKKK
jgi:hypothetical protein